MRAVIQDRYGTPEVLEVRDVDEPTPGDNGVLIRVHAASVNASDWETLRGKPAYVRVSGLRRPQHVIPGSDVAGTVVAVGPQVEEFQPGDEVLGDLMWHGARTFAEYVVAPEGAPLVHKPAGMTFVEAAAVPQAAVIARQGLGGADGVRSGDRVLVNGGGGGTGTFAIQMAKAAGAEVTGVDNSHKLDLMRSLGADHVVDYTREDAARLGRRYDVILDVAGRRSFLHFRRALTERGRYGVVGGSVSSIVQAGLLGPLVSRFGKRNMRLVMIRPSKQALTDVLGMVEAGTIAPVIDRTYALDETAAALSRLGDGRALGKVVISVAPQGD